MSQAKPYKRDEKRLVILLGISADEAGDYSPSGYLNIIERLEQRKACASTLHSERRAYNEEYARPFVVPLVDIRPANSREIMLGFLASRKFGGAYAALS